ncbi:CD0873 family tyrosine ABC transporter substrate-binding lipoprotein [Bacillaceae bacterium]
MRRALRLFSAVILAISVLVTAGCGQNAAGTKAGGAVSPEAGTAGNEASGENTNQSKEKKFSIGITQIVEHPALDSIRQGVLQGLAEHGFKEGENLVVDYRNAQNDLNQATTIAQKFVSEQKDLIVAITTPSAQAAAESTKEIPIVFSAVTDPVAAGLVQAFDQPGENITGTSDRVPIEKQLELIQEFLPAAKTIGIIYHSGEVNANVQVEAAKEAAAEKGLKIEAAGITSSSEVQQGAASLVGKVDAILIPIDNTVVSAFEAVLKVAREAKIPVFASDIDTVKRGAVATYGIDQFQIGVKTGEIAARILRGESPKNIPVVGIKDVELTINLDAAQKFGLQVSDALKNKAKEVIQGS